MDGDDPIKELQQDINDLKIKLTKQEALLKGEQPWEGDQLYQELEQLEKKRIEKQNQYKKLMRNHYKFVNTSWVQKWEDHFLQEKLDKGIRSLNHQIDNILYSRNSKSSISSSSYLDNAESMAWLNSEKEEKQIKQQQKIMLEIRQLQKILQITK